MALVSAWGYNGIRTSYIGATESVNLMIAQSGTTIGHVHVDADGTVQNMSAVTVTIFGVYAITANV